MNDKKNEEEQLFKSFTFNDKLIIYLFIFIILFFISFFLTSFKFTLSADSARYMISALIQSEATIFAIVITLSLVVVQQSATSYSPRVTEIFINKNKNPDFWILIIIYLGTMLYSAFVLKFIDDNLTPNGLIENNKVIIKIIENEYFSIIITKGHSIIEILTNIQTHIWMTYFMSFIAFVSLIQYIRNTLNLINPSNIIRILSDKITRDNLLLWKGPSVIRPKKSWVINYIQYWKKSIESCFRGPYSFDSDRDPILPIIDIVRGSLMKYDYETARTGLKTIENKIRNIIANEKFEHLPNEKFNLPPDFKYQSDGFKEFKEFKDWNDFEHYMIIIRYQNVFDHLENIGQLAVVRTDFRSSIEISTIIRNIILEILEKEIINQQAETIIVKGISSIKVIGITASNQKMDDVIIELAKFLRKIGDSAINKNMKYLGFTAFKAESDLRPESDEVWINLGNFHLNSNEIAEADFACCKAIEIEPSSKAWYLKADILQEMGDDIGSENARLQADLISQDENYNNL